MSIKILDKQIAFSGFFDVQKVECSDGRNQFTRFYVDKIEGCAIVLFNREAQTITIVKQFRIPLNEKQDNELMEIPAGIIDPREDPLTCVLRETEEETGYVINDAEHIYSFYTSPGYNNEMLHLYYAEVNNSHRTSLGGGVASEHENIQVLEYPISDIKSMMDAKLFQDAKTLVGLEWFFRTKVS